MVVFWFGTSSQVHRWPITRRRGILVCIYALDTTHPLIRCITEIIHLGCTTSNHYFRALYADSRFWFESKGIFSLELKNFGWCKGEWSLISKYWYFPLGTHWVSLSKITSSHHWLRGILALQYLFWNWNIPLSPLITLIDNFGLTVEFVLFP